MSVIASQSEPRKNYPSRGGAVYTALFWLFCPIIHRVFKPEIPKKLMFPQIAHIIEGTLLTFLPKVIFSTNEQEYRALFWLFCPIIQCVFTPKIPKKLIFPQIAPIIQGFIDFSPKKKWFFPKNATAYRALFWLFFPIIQCVFTPKIVKKSNFPQIAPIKQGTLLVFCPIIYSIFKNIKLLNPYKTFHYRTNLK